MRMYDIDIGLDGDEIFIRQGQEQDLSVIVITREQAEIIAGWIVKAAKMRPLDEDNKTGCSFNDSGRSQE